MYYQKPFIYSKFLKAEFYNKLSYYQDYVLPNLLYIIAVSFIWEGPYL